MLTPLRGNTLLFYNHHLTDPVASVAMRDPPGAIIGAVGGLGDLDDDSMHGGCEILTGSKIIANHWVDFLPSNRALVQPLWGPATKEMEELALGSLNVGDGIVWVFTSGNVQGNFLRNAAAAAAATMVAGSINETNIPVICGQRS